MKISTILPVKMTIKQIECAKLQPGLLKSKGCAFVRPRGNFSICFGGSLKVISKLRCNQFLVNNTIESARVSWPFNLLKGTGMLNETPEDSIASRQSAWAAGLQEFNKGQLRGGVDHPVHFSYRRRFSRLIFPIILAFSVSPDLYEGQVWLWNS